VQSLLPREHISIATRIHCILQEQFLSDWDLCNRPAPSPIFELYYFPVGDPDNPGYFIPAAFSIMILEENDTQTNRYSYIFCHRTGYLDSSAPKEIKNFIEDVDQQCTK